MNQEPQANWNLAALKRIRKKFLDEKNYDQAIAIENMIRFYFHGLISISWIDGEPKFNKVEKK